MMRNPMRANVKEAVKTNDMNDMMDGHTGRVMLPWTKAIQGEIRKKALRMHPRQVHARNKTNDL